MADFFASSSAAVAATHIQEAKMVPATPTDKAESATTTKNTGSNFSMCEIIIGAHQRPEYPICEGLIELNE
ncbi:unnamed protein product [Rhizoctonia solani]|uniref:Uncharacterized protein n=1 Tax=Rhizoctonia solani TaxID=456999 RepID=A0A8H3DU65_9AGAM|nr:unnamed protein product [Rhizoctonia solani]